MDSAAQLRSAPLVLQEDWHAAEPCGAFAVAAHGELEVVTLQGLLEAHWFGRKAGSLLGRLPRRAGGRVAAAEPDYEEPLSAHRRQNFLHDDDDDDKDDEEGGGEEDEEDESQNCVRCRPLATVLLPVPAAPERADRVHLATFDRMAFVRVCPDGRVWLDEQEGEVSRVRLDGLAWLRGRLQHLSPPQQQQQQPSPGCRRAGPLVFCEGQLPPREFRLGGLGEVADAASLSFKLQGPEVNGPLQIHALSLILEPESSSGVTAKRTHAWGRKKAGTTFEVARNILELSVPLASLRFAAEDSGEGFQPLELPACSWTPAASSSRSTAKQKLAYLFAKKDVAGGTDDEALAPSSKAESHREHSLQGYLGARCLRAGALVILEGLVLLPDTHLDQPFAKLPPSCRPLRTATLLVARGLPGEKLEPELLKATTDERAGGLRAQS
ncbi:unnamed protein product [Polarella glacialis]|uniref:Uncharacterized protein n=1 Tax=Polarella glacialis TaxID=89957 RepID=A0A813EV44_POLGL|nr:unnamed protein product [Polarella glacialis]